MNIWNISVLTIYFVHIHLGFSSYFFLSNNATNMNCKWIIIIDLRNFCAILSCVTRGQIPVWPTATIRCVAKIVYLFSVGLFAPIQLLMFHIVGPMLFVGFHNCSRATCYILTLTITIHHDQIENIRSSTLGILTFFLWGLK